MQDFCKFLVDNWQSILGAVLCAVSVAIQIFRKRPVADSLNQAINFYCKNFLAAEINIAEKKFTDGANKKDYVVQAALDWICKIIKLDEHAIEQVKSIIGSYVESFLSTPRKKY